MKEPLENKLDRLKALMKAPATKENLAKYATPGKKKALEGKKAHGAPIKGWTTGTKYPHKRKRPMDEDEYREQLG